MHFDDEEGLALFTNNGDGTYDLDVRELLLAGGQPYAAIISCVNQLAAGETLRVHTIFEPAPLVRKLEKRGFGLQLAHAGADHYVLSVSMRGNQ